MKKEAIIPLQEAVKTIASWLSLFRPKSLVRVTITDDLKSRTLAQNRRFWELMDHLGWEKEEAHDWACWKFLPPVEKFLPDGTAVHTMRGTSGLTTKEMSDFQDAIERFLAEHGLF